MGIGAFSRRSTDAFYSLTYLAAAGLSALTAYREVVSAAETGVADEHIISAVVACQAFLIFILARIYVVIHEIDDHRAHGSPFAAVLNGLNRKPGAALRERLIRLLLLCCVIFVVKPGFGVEHFARDFSFILRDMDWIVQPGGSALYVGRDFWRSVVYTGSVIFFVAVLFIAWDINAVAALSFDVQGVEARRMYCKSVRVSFASVAVRQYEQPNQGRLACAMLHDLCLIGGTLEYIFSRKFLDRFLLLVSSIGLCLLPLLPLEALVAIVILLTFSAVISWRAVSHPGAAYFSLISAAPLFVLAPIIPALRDIWQGLGPFARRYVIIPSIALIRRIDSVRLPFLAQSVSPADVDDAGTGSCDEVSFAPTRGEPVDASKPH